MSRTLRNRKRPDSVRMPAVPGLSKHPVIMSRSISAGPHSSPPSSHVPAYLTRSTSTTTSPKPKISSSQPLTPVLNKKQLEKIPSISAKSESSEDDELDNDGSNNSQTKILKEEDKGEDDDDDDDESEKDQIRKRTSVIKHEFTNTTEWSPCGGGSGVSIAGLTSGNGSIQTKNISTKMATGMRACKATGRSIMRMLSSSSSSLSKTTRRNSKTSCEEAKVNIENGCQKLNKVILN